MGCTWGRRWLDTSQKAWVSSSREMIRKLVTLRRRLCSPAPLAYTRAKGGEVRRTSSLEGQKCVHRLRERCGREWPARCTHASALSEWPGAQALKECLQDVAPIPPARLAVGAHHHVVRQCKKYLSPRIRHAPERLENLTVFWRIVPVLSDTVEASSFILN
eukprot:6209724-Pleurochrysis_carterae.AAC.1